MGVMLHLYIDKETGWNAHLPMLLVSVPDVTPHSLANHAKLHQWPKKSPIRSRHHRMPLVSMIQTCHLHIKLSLLSLGVHAGSAPLNMPLAGYDTRKA